MKRRRRNRRLAGIFACVLAVGLVGAVQFQVKPTIREMAKARVANRASYVINEAIQQQLQSGSIDYTDFVIFEKNLNGDITALKTNMAGINLLKAEILAEIDQLLLDMEVREIGLPLGSLILPELFSGTGPKLPVKVLSISTSDADFRSLFSEAGINQTTHQIQMDVTITMTILTPAGSESVRTGSSVIVAETVIVGSVPHSYVNVNRGTENGSENEN